MIKFYLAFSVFAFIFNLLVSIYVVQKFKRENPDVFVPSLTPFEKFMAWFRAVLVAFTFSSFSFGFFCGITVQKPQKKNCGITSKSVCRKEIFKMTKTINLITTCPFCGQEHTITVDEWDYQLWYFADLPAQKAFPYLSADEREMLISGICPTCWEKTFGAQSLNFFFLIKKISY